MTRRRLKCHGLLDFFVGQLILLLRRTRLFVYRFHLAAVFFFTPRLCVFSIRAHVKRMFTHSLRRRRRRRRPGRGSTACRATLLPWRTRRRRRRRRPCSGGSSGTASGASRPRRSSDRCGLEVTMIIRDVLRQDRRDIMCVYYIRLA